MSSNNQQDLLKNIFLENFIQFFNGATSGALATIISYPFSNIRLRAIER